MRWEVAVQKALRACGLEIHRTLPGAQYVQCLPFTFSTYRPWFEEWFEAIYAEIRDRTEVTADRCYMLYEFARHCCHLDGDMAECGVYRGGTAYLLAQTIARQSARPIQLHLFDTFAGMPATADSDPSTHRQGDFGDVSLDSVKAYLKAFANVCFHPGMIPETFAQQEAGRYSFVHVDVDLYQSVRDCCSFFYPRMVRGGVMIFDDYGFPHYRDAAKRAVDEFFRDKQERTISLATGQCLVIKL